ncbi:hypothetical protein SDC9_131016 [bioreactor metagenome]|uniref:Uncharacterized protein n=1 Tax=bioreactor metagenome TaxID=1076179 RepID=A0A645D3I7_9ZZZZ|nr:hypothetical protein [Oscillospiraceae bacterium]
MKIKNIPPDKASDKYSPEYHRIRNDAQNWPEWKKEVYNTCYATSKHAKKI